MRPAFAALRIVPAVAPLALVVGLAACGGGDAADTDDSVTEGEYTEEDYVAAGAEALDLPDDEQSRCIAQAIISGIGFDQIQATGLSPDDFSETETLADTGVAVDEAATAQIRTVIAGCGDLVATFVSSPDASAEEAVCAQDILDNDLIAELLVVELVDVEPSEALLAARTSLEECAAG